MSSFSLPRCFAVLVPVLVLTACNQAPLPQQQETPPTPTPIPTTPSKPKIEKLDDLPRHTYPVQGSVVDLVTSDNKFAALAKQVRADTESDLSGYDIEDKSTLKNLKGILLSLDLLEGKNDDARALIKELRDLEDKPAEKIMTGFLTEIRLDVQEQTKTTNLSDPAFQKELQKELTTRLAALPWNIVQNDLKETKGIFEIRTRNLLLGRIQSEIDPAVKLTGSLSRDLAAEVIAIRASIEINLPLKAPVVAALDTVIKPHTVAKPDIWKERAVMLKSGDKLTPVTVGIWDSGVDPADFPKDMIFTDPTSKDDPHGIAFDLHSNRVHGDLYPMGDNARRLPELKSQIKGILDLIADVDSPEASALKVKLGSLPQDQVKGFQEDLEQFGNYIHGSHVAGIATKGNPAAKILIARLTFDYRLIPEKPTVEQARKDAAADQAFVDYFRQHGVRVVNMSWGGSLQDVDDALEKNGVGDAEERKKEAREIFDIGKDGLLAALKSAPDILFVIAAGNSDSDINFDEFVPSSFVLPNILTVGAVDQAGDETSFTSFGKNVFVYANGFEVDSNIPGGGHLKLSGTSMAAPEVTNLAAKLFTLDPSLKPEEVIDLIKGGLTPNPDNPRIQLINPKKSIELLKARQTAK